MAAFQVKKSGSVRSKEERSPAHTRPVRRASAIKKCSECGPIPLLRGQSRSPQLKTSGGVCTGCPPILGVTQAGLIEERSVLDDHLLSPTGDDSDFVDDLLHFRQTDDRFLGKLFLVEARQGASEAKHASIELAGERRTGMYGLRRRRSRASSVTSRKAAKKDESIANLRPVDHIPSIALKTVNKQVPCRYLERRVLPCGSDVRKLWNPKVL